MHQENRANPVLAKEQHDRLLDIYEQLGLEIQRIDSRPGLPDMTYAANFGFLYRDLFIRSNYRYPQRRKEAVFAEAYFREQGFRIGTLPEDIFYEGQGDMLYMEGKIFCGYGKRTAPEAIPYLEKLLGQKIIALEINHPYFYHLDTCFAPIGEDTVVINPQSFTAKDRARIRRAFSRVIETGKDDNGVLCCNLVSTDHTLVTAKGITDELRYTLENAGRRVIETPMSEFRKGGGSVKCLTLEHYMPND